MCRWDVQNNDFDERDSSTLPLRVRARPITTIMRFGDYNHDGQSTEFFLQVDSEPCAKSMGVVVGVSRRMPRLHAFATVEHPEKPLVMNVLHWEALLRAKAPIRVIHTSCGDHGSLTITELEPHADSDGIHVTNRYYQCEMGGHRGQLIREEVR